MGIMDMFRGLTGTNNAAPAAPAPAPASTQQSGAGNPGNIPSDAAATGATPTTATAPNGVIPAAGTAPTKTPLDDFANLWQTDPVDPKAPIKSDAVFANVDPKKFMEAAGKIDFTKVVTPDQMTAIAQGGEAAQKAFAQAMNSVAQSVYAQSSFATTKIVDAAMARSKERFMADLPQHIKKQQVNDNLRSENPVFSNPAVQPIISALEAQLTVKYPNASATEITDHAKRYVEALGTSFAPKAPEPKSGSGKQKEVDWSSFLD